MRSRESGNAWTSGQHSLGSTVSLHPSAAQSLSPSSTISKGSVPAAPGRCRLSRWARNSGITSALVPFDLATFCRVSASKPTRAAW